MTQIVRSVMLKESMRVVLLGIFFISSVGVSAAQEFLPSPPPDRRLVYILDAHNQLVSLPMEQGQTPLHPEQISKSTILSYIELKGLHAATVVNTETPRWFL